MDMETMRAIVRKHAGASTSGNVRFLVGGDAVFPRIEEIVDAADGRIDIQTYIFDNDAYAVSFADRLKARSTDGVDVRIILDIIGSRRAWAVQAECAPPAPHGSDLNMIRYLRKDSAISVRRSHNLWLSSDHVKFIAIDGRYAFIGGMNIGWQYRHVWRDLMSEVSGCIVEELHRQFDAAWARTGLVSDLALLRNRRLQHDHSRVPEGDAELYLLSTTPWRHGIYRVILEAIQRAEQRVFVENPYLWNKQILYALCAARHRGVDVRVTIPSESNISVGRGADRMAANTLLKHAVRVFLYPGMTHTKASVIDNWAFWGSANLDDLSLHKNVELNVASVDESVVRELKRILVDGQDAAHEVLEPMPTGWWDQIRGGMVNFL